MRVINLDRSPERLAEFTAANAHLGELTRFPAVDGRAFDIAWLAQHRLVAANILDNYTLGAVGCALSHAALWDEAIAAGKPLTVCEDDVVFNRHFDAAAARLLGALPADWDIVVWGWNFDLFLIFEVLPGVSHCLAQFQQDRMRAALPAFQAQHVSPQAFRLQWAFGTPCYAVSAKGARELKRRLVPFEPITLPCPDGMRAPPNMPYYRVLGIDGALNSVYRHLNAYLCFPPLAVSRNQTAGSTVQEGSATGR